MPYNMPLVTLHYFDSISSSSHTFTHGRGGALDPENQFSLKTLLSKGRADVSCVPLHRPNSTNGLQPSFSFQSLFFPSV